MIYSIQFGSIMFVGANDYVDGGDVLVEYATVLGVQMVAAHVEVEE